MLLLHGLHYLKDDGVMAIILPHGVLVRGGQEEKIRTKLLRDGHVGTVIGLPANLFYSTGIALCVLVLKKCKRPDDVLFINASGPGNFAKGKRQNHMTEADIARIAVTYKERPEKPIPHFARRVPMAEIASTENNFNLEHKPMREHGRVRIGNRLGSDPRKVCDHREGPSQSYCRIQSVFERTWAAAIAIVR